MTFYEKMLKIDRRFIYFLVAGAVITFLLVRIYLPMTVSPPAQLIFDRIDSIKPGGHVLIAMDFDPASAPELYPMTLALLKHCFKKDVKPIIMTLWVTGAALGESCVTEAAKGFDKKSGIDYVYLGYKPGFTIVILSMGESIRNTFISDYRGNPTGNMPALGNVDKLGQLDFMIDVAAGASVDYWIAYGKERFKFDMGAGVTAVSATQYYPYLNTGQIKGLLGGLKGAAEYESMVKEPGLALKGMNAQSVVHLMTVIIVIFTNILYLISRSQLKRRGV